MTNNLLQNMKPAELIEYCLRLSAEIDAMNHYIKELRAEMDAYEEYRDVQDLAERAYSRLDNAESYTREYEIYLYEQYEKKKQDPELKVMDLNNEPEPKYKPGDVVWGNGLMGRHKIIGINEEYTSKTGSWSYDITSVDYSKGVYVVQIKESRILELDNEPEKERFPEFIEGDIVWVQGLEGRWQILRGASSFVGSDGNELFYYHVRSLDSEKPSTRTILEKSIISLVYDEEEED